MTRVRGITALVTACLAFSTAQAANQRFGPRADWSTGSATTSIALADFNGDGKIDVAASGEGGLAIRMNDGTGGLNTPVEYMGIPLNNLCTGDADGDGDIDLVTVNRTTPGTISVLLNDGAGAFSGRTDYAVDTFPSAAVVADINGDGKRDIVVANQGTIRAPIGTILVLTNNGDGTFAHSASYATGKFPYRLCAADLNGDGYLDLAVAVNAPYFHSDYGVAIFLNDGAGAFPSMVYHKVAAAPSGVQAADLDADGKLDLAVSGMYGGMSVLLNVGAGNFAPQHAYNLGTGASSITVADFDHNGSLDLAVSHDAANAVAIFTNAGSGNFSSPVTYTSGGWPEAIQAADLDGDGYTDLVTGNYSTKSVSTYRNLMGVCLGLTGNVDCDQNEGIDISDLTALIDHLYISLSPLVCAAEANIDGAAGIDISDLTALIDYLYVNYTLPTSCP